MAVEKNDLEMLSKLFKLGARAESPNPTSSYFNYATTDKMRVMLLEHGADPLKIVNTNSEYNLKCPALMIIFYPNPPHPSGKLNIACSVD